MNTWRKGDVLSWREVDFGWEVRNGTEQPVEIAHTDVKASAGGPRSVYVDGVEARYALPFVLKPRDVVEVSRKAPHMSESLQVQRSQKALHPMSRVQVGLRDAKYQPLALLR